MIPLQLILVVLALAVSAFAQGAPLSEEKLISSLSSVTPEERAATLRSLGIPDEIAQRYKDLNASMESEISWQRLRTSDSVKKAALFLPCLGGSGGAYLFLVGDSPSGWKVQDDYPADCHYKAAVSVELAANIIPGRDSILLHMVCDGHGTGFAEHHLHVFNPVHGRLREVLDTEESVQQGEELRRNVFISIASATGTMIEQTQITQRLDQDGLPSSAGQKVRRRTWAWSPEKHRMVATPFQNLNGSHSVGAP
jgi:hypothetical protein